MALATEAAADLATEAGTALDLEGAVTAWQPVAFWGAGLAQVLDISSGKLLYGTDTQGIGTSVTSPMGDWNQVQGTGLGKVDAYREVADVLWSVSEPGTGYALTSGGLLSSPGPDSGQPWVLRCADTTSIKGNGNTIDAGDAIPADDKMRPVGRLMVDDSGASQLWVGTYNHGIRRANIVAGSLTFDKTANMGGAAPGTNYYCVSLAQDPATPATLYAGTVEHKAAPLGYGGLWRCNAARTTGTPNFVRCTGGGLTATSVWDIKVLGSVIYLACGAGGLWMFDTAQYGDPATATSGWVNLAAGQAWAGNKWMSLDARVTTGTTHQVVAAASLGGGGDGNATAIVSITTGGTPRAVTARSVLCDTSNKAQWANIPPDNKQWWFSATETYGRLGTAGFCNPQIRFNPANAAHIFVVADMGLWRSTDSGSTWTIANKGHPGFLGRGPATDPTLPGYLIVGSTDWQWIEATDGGLDGANIRRTNTSGEQGLAVAVDPYDGTVYGTSSTKYTNAGAYCSSKPRGGSWSQVGGTGAFSTATGDSVGLGLCALRTGTGTTYGSGDPKALVVAVQGNTGTNRGGLYRWTSAGGWVKVQAWASNGSVGYYIPFAHVAGTSDVYAFDPKDALWHSGDFGVTWTRRAAQASTEMHSRALAAMPGTASRGEVWMSASKVLYRVTGAHTASPVKTAITLPGGRPAGPVGIKPDDGTIWCATLDDGGGCKMWVSADGGNTPTWTEAGPDGSFGAANFNPECIVFDGDRVTVTGSNVAVTYTAAAPPVGSLTQRQKSGNMSGTGSLNLYFGQGGGSANAANGTLAARIALDDCAATVTAPAAGWELAADAAAGTTTGQARAQIWLYRNAPAATVGTTSGAGATFTCSNGSASLKGQLIEWTPPAGQYIYTDRNGTAGALASNSAPAVTASAPTRVPGGIAGAMVATCWSPSPTGSGYTPPDGWTGDGAASNVALSWHGMSQLTTGSGTEAVTDAVTMGSGGTMTSWAMALVVLWASPVQVTTTTLASVPAGQSLSIPLSASGGSPSAATLVGMTVPYSARAYPNQGCDSPPYANGLSQQQADWEAMEAVSRGILYSGHRRPPVTKKFWFNGNFSYALSNCDMAGYLAQGTYVMICLYPQTDGVNGDVAPNGVWAAANPGGKYTDSTGVGGASPIRTQALADLASIGTFLTDLSAAGWTTDRCEIIFWQEPKNNLTQDQLNVMLRTYGAAVNGPSAPKDPNGDSYKLCLNLNGGGPTTVPTWARVGLGIGTDRWGTGPESTGLPVIDLLGLDWYLGSGGMTSPCEGVEAGTGWTLSKLADTYNGGTNLAINEVGCNPHPDPVPVGSKWDTMADCLQMMGNVHDWIAGRRTAPGGPPRHVNWWTANCWADGAGQLSSPIGLNPNYLAADQRIAAYQSWYDDLSGSGAPVYTWAKWAGTLPSGVTLSPAGVLSGVMSAGSWTFWAQVTDSAGNMAYSQALTLTATSALDITTTTVPPGAASEVYPATGLQAAGGTGTLTWTKTGALPTGMSLSSGGVLSGTLGAGTAGSYLVTVRCTDSLGVYDEIPLTITVNPALAVTSPAAVTATAGQAAAFLLTAAGGVPPYTWAISGGTLPTGLYLATDTITGAVSATGNYSWQVQAADPGGGTATLNMTLVVSEPLTVPAVLDSLVLAGQFELLAGGAVSDHPACPGAVFRLGRDWEPGMPQPVTDLLAQLGLDGERPMGRRASNRTVTIPITIAAPDRDTLAAAREALWQAVDGQTWELTWARAGGLPLAFDCFRASATTYVYSVIRDRQLVSTLEVTCQALPYGRSLDLETVVFAAPSAQWGTPANPVTLDDFSAVSSATQAGQWSQSGQAAAGTHSARWSRRWRDRPHYTHTLASPVNIGNRPKVTFWLGLGTSPDQYHVWRGGKITCDITLADTSGTEIRMAVTRHADCSGKTDTPAWTRITAAVPLTTLFDGTAVASYSIKIWNTTDHREGDRVLQAEAYLCWLEASAASAGSAQPRGAVYSLRGVIGTARTPLNIQVQPALTAGQTVPANWPKDTPGTYTWAPPAATTATLRATAGGSGGGGGYSSRDRGGGGGAGGEFAMEADWPVVTGQPVTAVVGAAGQAGANGQPGTRGGDTYFMIGGQEVLRAHAGDAGPAGNSATIARGGTGSRATVHFDGGDGGPPGQLTGSPDGSGGGSAGGWYTAGRAGEEPGRAGPGSGGTGVSGGGPGGSGGNEGRAGRAPANGPGGGGGGGDDDAAGGPGWPGRAAISYGVTAGIPIQALIVHQPSPDAPSTLSPLVRVGDGADTPDGNTEYAVPSPVTGLPARFAGTYTVAVGAASFASGSRTLTVTVHQYDEGVTVGGTGTVTGNGRETTVSVARTFAQADAPNGMVILGEVTLPARDLAPDQMTTAYTVTVQSTQASDRVNDVMFLDTEGSTVFLNTTSAGFANIWLDSPDPDRALGQVLGSYGGRDTASSILDDTVVSGPPLAAEPGDNWLLVYSPKGAPGAFMTYAACWFLDRLR